MGMTRDQRDLYDRVLADDSGRDLLDVLRDEPGSVEDKRAVADELGGPGAGQRDF